MKKNNFIFSSMVVLVFSALLMSSGSSTAKQGLVDNSENELTNISVSNVSEEPKNDINTYTTKSETEKSLEVQPSETSSAENTVNLQVEEKTNGFVDENEETEETFDAGNSLGLLEYSDETFVEENLYDEEIEEIKNHIQRIRDNYPNIDERAEGTLNELFNVYPNLTDEQYVQILESRGSDIYTAKPYQEAIIAEKNDSSSPRLTLEKAKSIIAENDNFDVILDEFAKVQPYPDEAGGSGVTYAIYWLNETGTEQIGIIMEQYQIVYSISDSEGKNIYTEYLYSRGLKSNG